jgi:hypothetical protein
MTRTTIGMIIIAPTTMAGKQNSAAAIPHTSLPIPSAIFIIYSGAQGAVKTATSATLAACLQWHAERGENHHDGNPQYASYRRDYERDKVKGHVENAKIPEQPEDNKAENPVENERRELAREVENNVGYDDGSSKRKPKAKCHAKAWEGKE